MKIILIIPDYGSFNNFLSELALELLQLGHNVVLIAADVKVIDVKNRIDFAGYQNFTYYKVKFPRKYELMSYVRASRQINKIVSLEQPDIINAHFTAALIALIFAKRKNFPYSIGTFHGMNATISKGLSKVVTTLVEFACIYRLCRSYVLNKEDVEYAGKFFKNKMNLIPTKGLGCDLKRFDPFKYDTVEMAGLKEALKISEADFVIIFIGRTVHFKGYGLVCKSFLTLADSHPNLKLLVIGGRDPIHRSGLTENEEKLLNEHDRFFPLGYQSNVEDYLAISDLLVFPSQKEGMPVCIMEALAMGVPVITSRGRGCDTLISDGHNGYLVETDSELPLVELLNGILKDTSKIMKMKSQILAERPLLDRKNYVKYQIAEYQEIFNNLSSSSDEQISTLH